MAKQKYYVVWNGRKTGIFTTWAECEKQVKGFAGARFKSYPTEQEADDAFHNRKSTATTKSQSTYKAKKSAPQKVPSSEIIWDSLSVDVGSRGNPGIIEYKGVDTKTGEVLFAHDEIPIGTNNMGEFLAIVHGLQYLKEQGSTKPIYSDSKTGMSWVKKKKVNATLVRNAKTEYIWSLVDQAEQWLKDNKYPNQIIKWETDSWGEIKADYGRK